ncbi:ABC transporter ATP-binding protein [Paenibacillus sp. L3-i20]|uniref:ABC transporter ATP-binding protein n=1 Tax=Paenibacillus sp. L3-i20 TaxID=2905833 RepID=UPI001EDEB2F0|nr:ABC transporter ATP-binding protein [Paenibacillus sp. L3-i20]GKU78184.1 HlyB/MsbA family ABC transporter [Paenibacillus sp. L3-i20]
MQINNLISDKNRVVFSVFIRFMPLMLKIIPGATILLILLKIITALLPVAQIYIVKELVDLVTSIFTKQQGVPTNVYTILSLQALILIANRVCSYLDSVIGFRTQQKLKFYFEQLLINKASQLPLSYFDRPDYYDQLERAAFGVDVKGFNLVNLIMTIGSNIITLVGLIFILLSFHWILAAIVLSMIIPNILVNAYFGKQKYQQAMSQTPEQRKVHYLLGILHSRSSAKEARIYDFVSYLTFKWKSVFWKTANEQYELRKRTDSRLLLVEVSQVALDIGVIIVLIIFGSTGALTIGHYVSLTQALQHIQSIISGLGYSIAAIYEESLFINEVLHFLDLDEENSKDRDQQFPEKLSSKIEVKNLSFTYATHTTPQLKGLSFTISPGEKIAIVGENGAGKSTLAKCLLGLYLPDQGSILFDGVDICTIDPKSMRQNVSAVFQDFESYQLTVRENIAMGHPKINDDAYIEAAAAKAGVGELIGRLPKGLDTELGAMFHNGHELSGGQWQKIALSRAFMRDAQIIILDEPTAALDPRAEAEIYDNFATLYEGKTTIMISHRLSSCRHADKIIVLHHGEIIEEGSHESLLAAKGAYAEMFHTQAKRYAS